MAPQAYNPSAGEAEADFRLYTPMYILFSSLSLIVLVLTSSIVLKTVIDFLSWKTDISNVGCGAQSSFLYALADGSIATIGHASPEVYAAHSHCFWELLSQPSVWLSQKQRMLVLWEINLSELEEKDVDELSSSGLRCPTCFAVRGRQCDTELKWCATDKLKCFEFSGIIRTGITNISIEMKKCIRAELCGESLTSYLGFPITNVTRKCAPALRSGAGPWPPPRLFFFLFLGELLH
ncbi:uncharacterized protein LOC105743498 [Octodon degus]|uniref:Uncharacterized protein LOC105743498 n=1 Tax=Octodon degus TaxID=10160 RepID=A0A6P3VDI8_OCTDE|nr:uncharacterized protein LOC105743498 [Octodon degus]